MARFHLNNKLEPGQCSAKPGNCPFGDDDAHYTSLTAARAKSETLLEELNSWQSLRSRSPEEGAPPGYLTKFKEDEQGLLNEGSYWGGDYVLGDGWSRRWEATNLEGTLIQVNEAAYPMLLNDEQRERYFKYNGDLELFREKEPEWDWGSGNPWEISVENYLEIRAVDENGEELPSPNNEAEREFIGYVGYTSLAEADEMAKDYIENLDPNNYVRG